MAVSSRHNESEVAPPKEQQHPGKLLSWRGVNSPIDRG